MKPPSDVARRAADDALLNVGVREVGFTNTGKYINVYLASVGLPPGLPWCAGFIFYRLLSAAERVNEDMPKAVPKSGYTPDWKNAAIRAGKWIPVAEAKAGRFKPLKGDLACFYFPVMGRIAHIGIVVKNGDKSGFVSVEGNTSDDDPGTVSRDGGGVWKRRRTYQSLGVGGGFIRLDDDPDGVGV